MKRITVNYDIAIVKQKIKLNLRIDHVVIHQNKCLDMVSSWFKQGTL